MAAVPAWGRRALVYVQITVRTQWARRPHAVVARSEARVVVPVEDQVVFADTVHKARGAGTAVDMQRDAAIYCGVSADGSVLARTAAAFVDVNVAVARQHVHHTVRGNRV